MSSSNCCFLICIQISQEAGQVVWYFRLFQNFLQFIVIHTVKGFVVNKAEADVFLELSCSFNDLADVSNLTTGSSAFAKSSLNIWKFTVHILLKLGLEKLLETGPEFKEGNKGVEGEDNGSLLPWTPLSVSGTLLTPHAYYGMSSL